MGFFDLNIPYDPSKSSKTMRMKVVIKAMELGYSGVAYNRTINGVMSDHDRCSIPLLSLSSLLNLAPSLASSVNFHRDLLGVPRSSPFRQYTRLTVCVESPSQSQVLNKGNPILKTYDLVAVRPLNQAAFDHACERSEVDIIAIDFSEKLPFRLRQPLVKAAMERGIYFEITYSDLLVDVQVRRQMISTAKLLVDWTRGKNLILSSDASCVTELRGPCDVANLSSLLGLSMERAKTAVSKNCRNLIINALRKKNFYKEAIRVELVASDVKSDSKEALSKDWFKWDPISSGEGDLQLDDLAKSFSDASRKSNNVKAIDFASIIDSVPGHGKSILSATKTIEDSVTFGVSAKPDGLDLLSHETDGTYLCNTPSKNQTPGYEPSEQLNLPSEAMEAFTNSEEIRTTAIITEEEVKGLNDSDALISFVDAEKPDLQSEKHIQSCESDVVLPKENVMFQTSVMDVETYSACVSVAKIDVQSGIEKCTIPTSSDIVLSSQDVAMDEDIIEKVVKDREEKAVSEDMNREWLEESQDNMIESVVHIPLLITSDNVKVKDVPSVSHKKTLEEVTMGEQCHRAADTASIMDLDDVSNVKDDSLAAKSLIQEEVAMEEQDHGDGSTASVMLLDNVSKVKDNSSVAKSVFPEDVAIKEQRHEEPTLVSAFSGKPRAKQRTNQQPLLFPFKRLLNPTLFKRKAKKIKRRP